MPNRYGTTAYERNYRRLRRLRTGLQKRLYRYDRDEDYFGGGRRYQYGQGIRGRGYGIFNRDYNESCMSVSYQRNRGYSNRLRGSGYNRENYYDRTEKTETSKPSKASSATGMPDRVSDSMTTSSEKGKTA